MLWLGALAAASALAWLAAICVGIVDQASRQEIRSADAIVVFGAAEYSGRPSPVYRARLDHAFDLFQQGIAPAVITTGGAAADPSFSEGGVGHDYLMHRGIPDSNLIAETLGSDTAQSAERVGVIMRTNHMHSCIAVSDAYHVFRIRKLLEHEGMQVYVSPRPDSRPHSQWQRAEAVLREAISYMVWRLHVPVLDRFHSGQVEGTPAQDWHRRILYGENALRYFGRASIHGSFEFVTASLREAATALRMTNYAR